MPSEATLRVPGAADPVRFVAGQVAALMPTDADLLALIEMQKTRILTRTARGVDYEERPFAAYSTKSPYTWYPHGRGLASKPGDIGHEYTAKKRDAAAKRLRRKLGAGQVTASGGVRFANYAEFKRALGRSGVDLTGPGAPHMLQALVSRITGPLAGTLGIYSADKAPIAEYINEGTPRMPRRQFLGTSAADKTAMERDLVARIEQRVTRGHSAAADLAALSGGVGTMPPL